jgi:short-subunit dehydrogenase
MKNIRGKLALVTGAASGIGRAIALALAREGANLFLVDIDRPHLAETADEAAKQGIEVITHIGDLSQPREINRIVESLLDTWARLDILVNNAGIAFYGPTEQMSEGQWEQILAVNLLAPIQLTRKLLPTLLARPEAHILNVCSIAGLVAMSRLAAYQTSKFALVGFSESLRVEYGPRGLGVTALCPGLVRTNIFQAAKTVPGKTIRQPSKWVCTSPERVATRAIRAIRRSEGLVLVTPMAHFLWSFKRFAPRLLDLIQQFRRHRKQPTVETPLVPQPIQLENRDDTSVFKNQNDSSEQLDPVILPFNADIQRRHKRAA